MIKKIIMVVVMVALFAGAVGVGVHVMNKDAYATDLGVVLKIDWNLDNFTYDVEAIAQLVSNNGTPIGLPILLSPNMNLTEYTWTFINVPSTAYKVVFTWVEDGWDWAPVSGTQALLNWSGTTALETSVTGNWR